MKRWMTRIAIALTFCLSTITLFACDPDGQPCNKGSVMSKNGVIYHCIKDKNTGDYQWHK